MTKDQTTTPDPLIQIGRDLAAAWDRLGEVVRQEYDDEDGCAGRRLGRMLGDLNEKIYALQDMACEIQASSVQGAMVQLMLAHSFADIISTSTDAQAARDMRRVSKLLYSALNFLEGECDTPRKEFGGEHYMFSDLDPHRCMTEEAVS